MARTVTFKGNAVTLVGPELKVGEKVPDATLTSTAFEPVKCSDLAGQVVLVSVTPSLDTAVCDLQAKRFNEEAAKLDGVAVVNVSLDLPPALKRWCGATGADNIVAVSDYKEREFGTRWGVLIDELKLLARSVFVVGPDGTLAYQEIVPEVTSHPDYDAALAAVRQLA